MATPNLTLLRVVQSDIDPRKVEDPNAFKLDQPSLVLFVEQPSGTPVLLGDAWRPVAPTPATAAPGRLEREHREEPARDRGRGAHPRRPG